MEFEGKKFDFKTFSTPKQDILEEIENSVTLRENSLFRCLRMTYQSLKNSEDKYLGWSEPVIENCNVHVPKSGISCVEKWRVDNEKEALDHWAVMLSISGSTQDITILFQKETDAKNFEKEIVTWLGWH